MGNCFRGSPTDDFTRLRTDDNHDSGSRDRRQRSSRSSRYDREPPPPYQQQQQQQQPPQQHQHRRVSVYVLLEAHEFAIYYLLILKI